MEQSRQQAPSASRQGESNDSESVAVTFNDTFERILTQSQAREQSSESNKVPQTPMYQNIFGAQSSYDKVITQVSQNVESSQTTALTSEAPQNGEVTAASNTASASQNPQRNHAQEEKEDELLKNISNYNSLIEQNLFISPLDPLSCIDSSQSSNIMMTNLTHAALPNKYELENLKRSETATDKTKGQSSN